MTEVTSHELSSTLKGKGYWQKKVCILYLLMILQNCIWVWLINAEGGWWTFLAVSLLIYWFLFVYFVLFFCACCFCCYSCFSIKAFLMLLLKMKKSLHSVNRRYVNRNRLDFSNYLKSSINVKVFLKKKSITYSEQVLWQIMMVHHRGKTSFQC